MRGEKWIHWESKKIHSICMVLDTQYNRIHKEVSTPFGGATTGSGKRTVKRLPMP